MAEHMEINHGDSPASNTRGSREAEKTDLMITNIEWAPVNEGYANYFDSDGGTQSLLGGFQVGKTTTITVTIVNENPTVIAENVKVNFTIRDWYSGIPMQRNPATKIVTLTGVTTVVPHDFTPPFAGQLFIVVTVDYPGDTDSSNNGMYLTSPPTVFIWSADFESSGTDWGWQKLAEDETVISNTEQDWTGDIGTSVAGDNKWHITDSPANQMINEHTQRHAWAHGYKDNYVNTYSDNAEHLYLETPQINMGEIIDGQKYRGELEENQFYADYMPMYCAMITGELEDGDLVYISEISDNSNGDNWRDELPVGGGVVWGDYSQVFTSQTTPHWNPLYSAIQLTSGMAIYAGYPFDIFIGDGNGDMKDVGGARNWSHVRFRCDFRGDNDGEVAVGTFYDDFVTWGVQDYIVEHRVGITEINYPLANVDGTDVPILLNDTTAHFRCTIKNYGKSQTDLPINLSIKEVDDGVVGNEINSQRLTINIPNEAEKETSWSWTPPATGDYRLILVVGYYDRDWTPGDNKVEYYLHVGPEEDIEVDVLVVDDDNSIGSYGITLPYWIINTEVRMLRALEDNVVEYRVYTVEYNKTGPEFDIMSNYKLVIWMTGLDNEYDAHHSKSNYKFTNPDWDVTLKAEDIDELEKYLELKDKKLWLISPGFIYDYYGGGASLTSQSDFARQYLHIAGCQANDSKYDDDNSEIIEPGTPNPLVGVENTCMEGVNYTTYDPPPPDNFDDIGGWVEVADKDTKELFYQNEDQSKYNAVFFKGTEYITSYYAFNFYLISDRLHRKDCVFRMLTCFDLMGGVIITPLGESQKTIYPGQEISFRFTVENTGKKQDTMTLSMIVPINYQGWSARWEVDGRNNNTVTIPGLEKTSGIFLFVQAPSLEDFETYIKAGTLVEFVVTASSKRTGLESSTAVYAEVGAVGNITIDCPKTQENIKVEESAEFSLYLENETNGREDISVKLSLSGQGKQLAKFVVNDLPTGQPEVETILEPNDVNKDIELEVAAGEHTIAGYHNLTVHLKDDIGDTIYDSVDLSVMVDQFYRIKCTTSGELESGEVNFTIDPNHYRILSGDYIKKSFMIGVQNFGNGPDIIKLYHEENPSSDIISGWLFKILSPESEDIISYVNVSQYDESTVPQYGEEQVQFDVYIPKDTEVGNYLVDFVIESSHTEIYNPNEDELLNNRVSFVFNIIKPNLRFTKLNDENLDNFEFWDYYRTQRIIREPEYNNNFYLAKEHYEFEELSIEFKAIIQNNGDTEIALGPYDVWLNITHYTDDNVLIHDDNLTPEYPANEKLIAPNENATFTFLWNNIYQEPNTEVEYIFDITVDPLNQIFEKDEQDNSDEITITIKSIKKAAPPEDDYSLLFYLFGLILIVGVILLIFLTKRRRPMD